MNKKRSDPKEEKNPILRGGPDNVLGSAEISEFRWINLMLQELGWIEVQGKRDRSRK